MCQPNIGWLTLNSKITAKERGLIKGALRRIFSRSDLRRSILEARIVPHSDPKRGRVKTWCQCAKCQKLDAKSNFAVDHIEPLIPLDSSLENMSWDSLIDRLWCDPSNLQLLCDECHDAKSKAENKQRREFKKNNLKKQDKKSKIK